MDLRGLRRRDGIKKVVDRATEVYDGVVEAVTGAVDELVEQQEGYKEEKIAEILGERDKLHVQADDINKLNGHISNEEPIIVLGELDPQSDSYVVAVVSTQFSQVRSGHETEGGLPHITFYKIDETELRALQQNPFKRFHQEDGVVAVGEHFKDESVFGRTNGGFIEKGVEERVPQIPDPLLSPLGALAVTVEAGVARKGLENFRQSLDMLRSAMYDSSLNPQLVELLGKPASGSSTTDTSA